MWEAAVETEAFRAAVAGAVEYRQEMLRLFGIPESEIAETLRGSPRRASASTAWRSRPACGAARSRWSPASSPRPQAAYDGASRDVVRERHADTLFSEDGSTVDEQVARLLRGAA